MAKKSLGYLELEWVCPTCNARNAGSKRTCQGCGAPQPPDVKFEAPNQVVISKEAAVAEQATAAPDIHCPYCDARNPANSKVCKQCGGDLTDGQARQAGAVVSGLMTSSPATVKCQACATDNPAGNRTCKNCGAPLPALPKAVAAPAPAGNSGCLWIGLGAGAAVILLVVVLLFSGVFSGGEVSTVPATVSDARWVRAIDVQGLVPVRRSAWLDEIPADAIVGNCAEEVRATVDEPVPNSREVCGTPYAIDQGTGFAEVVQDCVYEVLDQYCSYTINEWRVVETLTQEGSGFSPEWPVLPGLSRQRAGDRSERYECIFNADGATYRYRARSYEEYLLCTPNSRWNLEVNQRGDVIRAAPAQ